MRILKKVDLARYTSFKVGGPAQYFVRVKSEAELVDALNFARSKKILVHFLGSGSNLLISDAGVKGLVIKNEIRKVNVTKTGKKIILSLGAGEDWQEVVKQAATKGWAGIEGLAGIPGTAGAAPVQNIGAYGQSLDQVVQRVRALDLNKKNVNEKSFKWFTKAECDFSYRNSIFKKKSGRFVITEIELALKDSRYSVLNYRDSRFNIKKVASSKQKPLLKDVYRAVIKVRSQKGMLLMDGYDKFKSAGSFFTHPMVSKEKFKKILAKARALDAQKVKDLEPWHWQQNSKVKIATAFLLEFTKFHKGYREECVGISPKHSLQIINCGHAHTRDIVHLAKKMQRAVNKTFDVWLEPEVRTLGFVKNPLNHR